MVERSLAKAEVAGSSPVSRSNFYDGSLAVIKIGLSSRGSKLRRKTILWIVLPEPGSAAERLRCAMREQSTGEAKSPVSRIPFSSRGSKLRINFIWRHSQAVRQRSAKPSPPVRFWVAPPAKYSRNDTIREYFFYAKSPDFLGFFGIRSFDWS